jgi:hypothetical protein
MLICFRERKTHVLLTMSSYGCYSSVEAVTQAICLLLKPVQPNEHIILNASAIRVIRMLYVTGRGQ